jgi:hypothetical protein
MFTKCLGTLNNFLDQASIAAKVGKWQINKKASKMS